ncbi:MAG: stage II sporulation protein M [Gloeocapsa sp. DLM2.Bin57]|nr:MAG: stage II sporulation protein M [Gloeocapsa sp. DLM2.Bin57]
MNIQRWIARRETDWRRLDSLLKRVESKGLKSLPAKEITELASLYRSVSADLARAKTYQIDAILTQDLQNLTSRSYVQIYQGSRQQEWQQAKNFYANVFPTIVRETFPYTLLATLIFFIPALIAWWYIWLDPTFVNLVVPQEIITLVRDENKLWMGSIIGTEPLASSNIMINNLSVSFNAVAGGITAGILTVYILAFNGIHIGSIAAFVAQNNLSWPFWAFVFPHGSLELPAIFWSGGAGLLIARGLLFPGRYRRFDAIKYYSSLAAKLVLGIIPMLVIAGIIEGFFSPSPLIPDILKYILGLGIFILLLLYCQRGKHESS